MRSIALLVALLVTFAVAAQVSDGGPQACVPSGDPFDRASIAHERAAERERYQNNAQNVARYDDTLRLVLDIGKPLELVDCPYGDTGYLYLYERFDDGGPFYVIRTPGHEDLSYTLAMKRSGKLFTVYGAPVWAQDKSRFLTVACSLLPERSTLSVLRPSGEDLVTETEVDLPCAMESCLARWDFQSWISISCTPRDDTGKRGTEFVMMRGNDGAWKKFGR